MIKHARKYLHFFLLFSLGPVLRPIQFTYLWLTEPGNEASHAQRVWGHPHFPTLFSCFLALSMDPLIWNWTITGKAKILREPHFSHNKRTWKRGSLVYLWTNTSVDIHSNCTCMESTQRSNAQLCKPLPRSETNLRDTCKGQTNNIAEAVETELTEVISPWGLILSRLI